MSEVATKEKVENEEEEEEETKKQKQKQANEDEDKDENQATLTENVMDTVKESGNEVFEAITVSAAEVVRPAKTRTEETKPLGKVDDDDDKGGDHEEHVD